LQPSLLSAATTGNEQQQKAKPEISAHDFDVSHLSSAHVRARFECEKSSSIVSFFALHLLCRLKEIRATH
jgi:hypothetical protein